MYPITSTVKNWFEAEKKQVVRITGDTVQKLGDNIDVYSGTTKIYGSGDTNPKNIKLYTGSTEVFDSDGVKTIIVYAGDRALYTNAESHIIPIHLEITASNIMQDQFSIDRYSSNSDKLEVGTAIASEMTLKLDNRDGKYDGVIFEGAELYVEIGISGDWDVADPEITWIPCGYFTSIEQPRRLNTITLNALDRMTWLDKPVDASQITLPITVQNLFLRCCAICNLPVRSDSSYFPNRNYNITTLPNLTNITVTYRNLVQWCAGMMGSNAWIDWNGEMCLNWYNVTNPNVTYASRTLNRFNSDLFENELSITGVQFVANDENHTKYISGTDDYAIDLSDNALIGANVSSSSDFATVLNAILNRVGTLRYTPFSASVINAPYLYPMDQIWFYDKNNISHRTVVSNVNFGVNGATALAGKGLSLKANTGVTPNGSMAAMQNQVSRMQVQFTNEMTTAIDRVTNQITGAIGGYVRFIYDPTTEKMKEIVIMDTEDITTAQKVWRWNQNGLGYSENGYNGTYALAMTQNGEIVANFITTGELSANRIHGGTLTLGGTNGAYGKLVIKDDQNANFGTWDEDGINVNNGNFKVDPSGNMTCTNAEVSGKYDSVTSTGEHLTIKNGVIEFKKGYVSNTIDMQEITNVDEGMVLSSTDAICLDAPKIYVINNNLLYEGYTGIITAGGINFEFVNGILVR